VFHVAILNIPINYSKAPFIPRSTDPTINALLSTSLLNTHKIRPCGVDEFEVG
jgi:hypothetical protein